MSSSNYKVTNEESFAKQDSVTDLSDGLGKLSTSLDPESKVLDDPLETFLRDETEDRESDEEKLSVVDAIDEDYLQELEKNQTDEEKAKLKESAQKLKEDGNKLFRDGEFESAIRLYTRALQSCPLSFTNERSIMYANRATTRMKLDQNEEAVMDCSKALDLNPNYVKAVLRRAQLYQKIEKLDESLSDYQRVMELDPNILEAREAVMRLPDEINQRNEKLKTEMLGKLKDLGNMFLRPFGFSTDNFNLVKDETSGGYSVNFQQNKEK